VSLENGDGRSGAPHAALGAAAVHYNAAVGARRDPVGFGRWCRSLLTGLLAGVLPACTAPSSGVERYELSCEKIVSDFVLPSCDLEITTSGVWCPRPGDPLHALVAPPDPASDHLPTWVDLRVGGT
jgi:hypothetical protein